MLVDVRYPTICRDYDIERDVGVFFSFLAEFISERDLKAKAKHIRFCFPYQERRDAAFWVRWATEFGVLPGLASHVSQDAFAAEITRAAIRNAPIPAEWMAAAVSAADGDLAATLAACCDAVAEQATTAVYPLCQPTNESMHITTLQSIAGVLGRIQHADTVKDCIFYREWLIVYTLNLVDRTTINAIAVDCIHRFAARLID